MFKKAVDRAADPEARKNELFPWAKMLMRALNTPSPMPSAQE